MSVTTEDLHKKFEPHPDPKALTSTSTTDVDYEPNPSKSLSISPTHTNIITSICNLYSGSASESDMSVYAAKSIYDDPWSYCDTRYKIAGQWYGIPKIFASSKTIKTQVVKDTETDIVFKLQQEYTPKVLGKGKKVNSLVSLVLDEEGNVRYHKDMWNDKDYSHGGLGKWIKELNGNQLTMITKPPEGL